VRLPVVVAFVVSLGIQPFVIRLLVGRSVMDTPNQRSSHVVPTPRGGGIAVVVAMAIGLVLAGAVWEPIGSAVLVVLLAMALLGFTEDVRGLPPMTRLAIQFVVALATSVVVGVPLGWITLSTVFLVGYVNVFNFMDGVNGISGLNAAVTGLVYAWLGSGQGSAAATAASLVLAAAALGFLPWNMPRARVFLGDVGSYAIGGAVAALGLGLLVLGAPWVLVVAPLSLYLVDTGVTLARRVAAGEPVLEAHRNHTYQRLVDCGFSHSAVAATTAILALVSSWLAWEAMRVTGSTLAALIPLIVVAGVYLALPAVFDRGDRLGQRSPQNGELS
jgi:UDP-N-acetylmuramyl pentapeptide phosphotransferase/UDP-N-acetylglucosamine-1-phosphate transferase